MDKSSTTSPLSSVSNESVINALKSVHYGKVISLASGWWPGMPVHPVHPRFQCITYRTPHGLRVQRDQDYMNLPTNSSKYGFISDLILATTHSGTHIDAFAHVTIGERDEWFGGHFADEELGDFGPRSGDASELPPIIARGVLLDIPSVLGLDHCPSAHGISPHELEAAADLAGVELRAGDVVLVRTGQMRYWPDSERMAMAEGAGVSIDGARWLAERQPLAVGSDTVQFECTPSGVDGSPQPVHVYLMQERGIPIMEWVHCEPLVNAGVSEFAFICIPLPIRGATGSLINPIALV